MCAAKAKEWLEAEGGEASLRIRVGDPEKALAMAFNAGWSSAMPKELRETLIEACAVAAQHATSAQEHNKFANARKQLGGE